MGVPMRDSLSCTAMAFSLIFAPLAWAPTDATVEAANATFPYSEMGEGKPILFIHGALGDQRVWEGIRDKAAAKHRFLALTLRHYGSGNWPDDKPYSRDVHEADQIAVLQAWNEPMHLVGYSYSGPIVLRAAIEVPDLVKSVTIYEPTFPSIIGGTPEGDAAIEQWYDGFADTGAAAQAGDLKEATREAIEYVFGWEEGGFEVLPESVRVQMLENAHTLPLDATAAQPAPLTGEQLATAKTPTMLIVGSNTYSVFRQGDEAIAGCMPNADVRTLDGVGHGGPIMAQDAFLSTVLEFVDQQ